MFSSDAFKPICGYNGSLIHITWPTIIKKEESFKNIQIDIFKFAIMVSLSHLLKSIITKYPRKLASHKSCNIFGWNRQGCLTTYVIVSFYRIFLVERTV